jgi:DNA-binding NtrC family response regulator
MSDHDKAERPPTNIFRLPGLNYNPGLLVAYAPHGNGTCDRLAIDNVITVGRQTHCDLSVDISTLSREHFRVFCNGNRQTIEDLGSKNGTYVNGHRIDKVVELKDRAIIRAGQVVFVFCENVRPFLGLKAKQNNYGLVGQFQTTHILSELADCAYSSKNLLLHGPTGGGKEAAAHALAKMMGKPLTIQNAARFASDEEAFCALLGVGDNVFSGVDARTGCIEEADKGLLFIDQSPLLSKRVQKTLLRIIKTNMLARVGETKARAVEARFVFASDEPEPYVGIDSNLFPRLRTISVPPLYRRPADVPSIFNYLFTRALEQKSVEAAPILDTLLSSHYESLMLDGFREYNVRSIIELVDRLVTSITSGTKPKKAILKIFTERYATEYPSPPPARKDKKDRKTDETT